MNYDKISPALAGALDDLQAHGRQGLEPHGHSLGLISTEPVHKPPRAVVFIRCDDAANLDHLAGEGIEINGGGGRARTGIVPFMSLDRLSEDDAVQFINPARRLRLHMDVAPGKVGVPPFRLRTGMTGQGVVVGVVDSGIEPLHPAFDARILRIWDQTIPGPGVIEGRYGAELTGDLQQISRDTVGHGTHVAGIAAGADPTYGGIAPEATILVVKTDLLDAHVADGVRYVFRVAGELGLPAVVNLSLGSHGDAHDGTDPLSTVIDEQVGPGRIVCCSAGNEGNDNIHGRVQVAKGHTRSLACSVPVPPPNIPSPSGPSPSASFNGWYAGTDQMAVAVVAPSGAGTPFQTVITGGSPARVYTLTEGSVRIATPRPDPANGDHNFLVDILPIAPTGTQTTPGIWRLRIRGDEVDEGRVDVWSIDGTVAQFTGRALQDSLKIGSPGAASAAVTVGSYTTRVEWVDLMGHAQQAGFELDTVTDFSSEGPRRDSLPKPDLIAPGAMIASSLSVNSGIFPEMLIDDLNTLKAGTSMSSPFVAGLVALLLQREPDLDPDAVKEVLRAHCSVPGCTPGAYDPKWGYGLIDAQGL